MGAVAIARRRLAVLLLTSTMIPFACGTLERSPTATIEIGASPTALASASASQAPSVTVVPSPSVDATVDPDMSCVVTTDPGPADEPPWGSGEMDFSDLGAGRYRLCLTGPIAGTFEHTAWCSWSPDRTVVTSVSGLPTRIDDVAYGIWAPLADDAFELSTTDARGRVSTYRAGADSMIREVVDNGRDGSIAFAVELYVDPESGAHPGAPAAFIGAMGWTCGNPPAPR